MGCVKTQQIDREANTAGFTLVEVLVAMLIFAIGFTSVALMQSIAVRSNGVGKFLTERSTAAQAQMETLLGLPFAHTNLVAGTYTTTLQAGSPSAQYPLNMTWNIQNNPTVALKVIRVTVTDPNARQTRLVRIKDSFVY